MHTVLPGLPGEGEGEGDDHAEDKHCVKYGHHDQDVSESHLEGVDHRF